MKKIAACLATAGVLATALMPMMASASTVQNHATSVSPLSMYSVNSIKPEGSYSNAWGTASLSADDANLQFMWQLSPNDKSKTYTYNMGIDYYRGSTYVGTISMKSVTGAGVLSGYVPYPRYLPLTLYTAKLNGYWTASDGTTGSIGDYLGQATTPFYPNY
ncbi:hypothetical protein [Tumebacillus flagellatus]|uniref:Uncharacterized protein n=1 Tax=Tumebacillus flagellatus TaxID=1157490 RepID=A0A074LP94_9BACL|nr:hypothetical protein [Tumebacillus flagellatus]KEO82325.1 hypothetical protein EL26_16230 [Tumebacillus flagellatus]